MRGAAKSQPLPRVQADLRKQAAQHVVAGGVDEGLGQNEKCSVPRRTILHSGPSPGTGADSRELNWRQVRRVPSVKAGTLGTAQLSQHVIAFTVLRIAFCDQVRCPTAAE